SGDELPVSKREFPLDFGRTQRPIVTLANYVSVFAGERQCRRYTQNQGETKQNDTFHKGNPCENLPTSGATADANARYGRWPINDRLVVGHFPVVYMDGSVGE